jgi:chromosome partitioning protein
MILAIINQKGGVGKTTTTVNLGAALAQAGHGVLLLDLDPQGSLSSFGDTEGAPSLLDLPQLTVRAATPKKLAATLRADDHDFILLDCPPTLGPAHAAALLHSDLAIAPMPPKFLDAHGLAQLTQTVEAAHERGNPALRLQVLLTMRDGRVAAQRELEEAVRGALGARVFQTVIPHAAVFDKAALAHLSALQMEPRSAGARAYRALAQELLEAHHGA